MAVVPNKRSMMVLYSGIRDPYSHLVRIVLAEKGIPVDIISVNPEDMPEDLLAMNPYHSLPTLVDRDLVLYSTQAIIEYFDERYPHPPLMPGYPVARAECRLMMYRIENDWYSLMHMIHSGTNAEADAARKQLGESLVAVDAIFSHRKYFMGEEYTLVDCMMIPLLWRLKIMGIVIPPSAKSLIRYMKRLFTRDTVQASFTDVEREMNDEQDLAAA